MRNIVFITFGLLFFFLSCAPSSEQVATHDFTTVSGLRSTIKEKTSAISDLQVEIGELNKKLLEIDPSAKRPKVPVEVKSLESHTFESFSTFQAAVVASDLGMASSETGGRITSLLVKEGDYVQKGQLIAMVNLETIEMQKQELLSSLSLAKTVYERQERLWSQNIGSEIQYLEAKNTVERIQKSLETFDTQLAKKNVYAPISGVIDNVVVKQGEMSSPGGPIVMILNTGNLTIEADVPERFLSNIKRGSSVDVYFPAIDREFKKTIRTIGRRIDPANRTFKIEMSTSSMGGKIKPNLLAEVTIMDRSIAGVITIPVNLLQQEVSGENFVFIEEDSVAMKRMVKTGDSNDDRIIIDDGLVVGDRLIMVGAVGLSKGAELKVSDFVQEEDSDK